MLQRYQFSKLYKLNSKNTKLRNYCESENKYKRPEIFNVFTCGVSRVFNIFSLIVFNKGHKQKIMESNDCYIGKSYPHMFFWTVNFKYFQELSGEDMGKPVKKGEVNPNANEEENQ